jgi:hypothetical protein
LASDCSVGAVSAVGAMVVVGDPAGAAVVVAQPANAAVANNPASQLFVIASTLRSALAGAYPHSATVLRGIAATPSPVSQEKF